MDIKCFELIFRQIDKSLKYNFSSILWWVILLNITQKYKKKNDFAWMRFDYEPEKENNQCGFCNLRWRGQCYIFYFISCSLVD